MKLSLRQFLLVLPAVLFACQSTPSTSQSATTTKRSQLLRAALPTKRPTATPTPTGNDFLIVPGDRVGIIQGNTFETELLRLLGSSVVTVADTLYGAEGETFIGTTLYKGTADEVQINYADADERTHPATVRVSPTLLDDDGNPLPNLAPSRWVTTSGVRIGTTLRELERLNSKPFKLWGFAWDYSGLLSNWQGGKMTQPDKKAFLAMSLGPPLRMTAEQEKAYNDLMGDGEFLSSTAAMQRLNPVVGRLETTVD